MIKGVGNRDRVAFHPRNLAFPNSDPFLRQPNGNRIRASSNRHTLKARRLIVIKAGRFAKSRLEVVNR